MTEYRPRPDTDTGAPLATPEAIGDALAKRQTLHAEAGRLDTPSTRQGNAARLAEIDTELARIESNLAAVMDRAQFADEFGYRPEVARHPATKSGQFAAIFGWRAKLDGDHVTLMGRHVASVTERGWLVLDSSRAYSREELAAILEATATAPTEEVGV